LSDRTKTGQSASHDHQPSTLCVVLTLDDPRWPSLDHRGWSDGGRSGDDDAPFVPDELRYLQGNPTDRARFTALWPYLCSEDTAWPAAYAAVRISWPSPGACARRTGVTTCTSSA
jgi:hypothetical protein